mmetsp:Transcript_51983/g.92776  ORF Transcript_51983/g.92776 Transcript_51983/m.92776 type:complete len:223 (+) Transcript_51983:1564-2232(+)
MCKFNPSLVTPVCQLDCQGGFVPNILHFFCSNCIILCLQELFVLLPGHIRTLCSLYALYTWRDGMDVPFHFVLLLFLDCTVLADCTLNLYSGIFLGLFLLNNFTTISCSIPASGSHFLACNMRTPCALHFARGFIFDRCDVIPPLVHPSTFNGRHRIHLFIMLFLCIRYSINLSLFLLLGTCILSTLVSSDSRLDTCGCSMPALLSLIVMVLSLGLSNLLVL